MSVIHDYVDKVYVINLDKDRERLKHMDEQCKQHQINYVRFPAILGSKVGSDLRISTLCNTFCTDGTKGCALSHRSIWEHMLKHNVTKAVIFEDDIILDNRFDEKTKALFQNLPERFDIVYLYSLYNNNNAGLLNTCMMKLHGLKTEEYNSSLMKCNGCMSAVGYIIHIDFIKKILKKPITMPIDMQLISWIKEFNSEAFLAINSPITFNTQTFESNLADSFPMGINTMLKQIKINETYDLYHCINSNLFQIFSLNINFLILFLCILVFFTPKHYLYVWGIWLVGEGLLAMDIRNTFRYGVFLGGTAALSFYLQNRFLKVRRRR